MAQTSAGSPQVVWCEFRDSQISGMFFNHVPYNFFSYFVAPCAPISTDASEELAHSDPYFAGTARGVALLEGGHTLACLAPIQSSKAWHLALLLRRPAMNER